MLLQGAVHFFTARPDLTVRSLYHSADRCQIWPQDIIAYPHAVSSFQEMNLSIDYIASEYSRRRKADVLLSVVGILNELCPNGEQYVQFIWASEGRCVTEGSKRSVIEECDTPDFSKIPSAMLPSGPHHWERLWDKLSPIEIADEMSKELGVYLGGLRYNEFLANRCTLKKQRPWGGTYVFKHEDGFLFEP